MTQKRKKIYEALRYSLKKINVSPVFFFKAEAGNKNLKNQDQMTHDWLYNVLSSSEYRDKERNRSLVFFQTT